MTLFADSQVRSRKDGKIYVLKRIKCAHLTPARQKEALMEALLLRGLDHPNVIGYYTSFVEKKTLHILMEVCNPEPDRVRSGSFLVAIKILSGT